MAQKSGGVKSVLKGLDLLEHLAAAHGPVTLSELGRATGVHVTTAHRLLRTLALRGWVDRDAARHAYRLGPRILALGSAYLGSLDLVAVARPRLDALRDELEETVHLAVYSQGEVVELAQAVSRQAVTVSTRPGQRAPAYCTALGKVLLAGLPPADLRRYLREAHLAKRGPRTITDVRALAREIERVRVRGWALDDEEFAADLCCVGAPVHDGAGRTIAALSAAAPKTRFRAALVPRWVRRLQESAAAISRELGFNGTGAGR